LDSVVGPNYCERNIVHEEPHMNKIMLRLMGITYLPLSLLEVFRPNYRFNMIYFIFDQGPPEASDAPKIVRFLETLDKNRARYCVISESLPLNIFSGRDEIFMKNLKQRATDATLKDPQYLPVHQVVEKIYRLTAQEGSEHAGIFEYISSHTLLPTIMRRIGENSLSETADEFNAVLDVMFSAKAKGSDELYWDNLMQTSRVLGYDFAFHYIENKMFLGRKDEIQRNTRLINAVQRTYERRKEYYDAKTHLEPRDNRWAKLIIMMSWLGILRDREHWIKKYSSYEFMRDEQLFPQAWNRVWALTYGLGITRISDLQKLLYIDYPKVHAIISSYIPQPDDMLEQNYFTEANPVMIDKYLRIRRFLELPMFTELLEFERKGLMAPRHQPHEERVV
jgi:hypothetical protein